MGEPQIEDDGERKYDENHQHGGAEAVYDVRAKPLEDAPALQNRGVNGRKSRFGEHNVCRRPCRIGSSRDSDADIRTLERGGVVDAIARHSHGVVEFLLLDVNDLKLVVGRHFSKAVRVVDEQISRARLGPKVFVVVNAGAQLNLLCRLLRDVEVIARDHLDAHLGAAHVGDRLGSIVAGRIPHGQNARKYPLAAVDLRRDCDRLERVASQRLVCFPGDLADSIQVFALPLERT